MQRYALVVGISTYESSSLPSLAKPQSSAEAVAAVLEEYGDFQDVQRLPARWLSADRCEVSDQRLTATELITVLNRFLDERLKEGGEALVYFSGHGFVMTDALGGSEAFLAASDTELGVQNGQVVWQRNSVPLRSLSQKFSESNFSSLVILLDCCHSGMLLERDVVQQVLSNRLQRSYSLIAACRDFEKAYEGGQDVPHSVFTAALLRSLSRETFGALGGQVTSQDVAAAITRELRGKGQEPVSFNYKQPMMIVSYPAVAPVQMPEQVSQEFDPNNPYVGLYAFEGSQADRFFGREQASWDVISRLAEHPFLAVVGASGSGKSSLIRAGVLPKLRGGCLDDSDRWCIAVMTPGQHPRRRLMRLLEQQTADAPSLIVIDQFEETFTVCEDEAERRGFIRLMASQVAQAQPHKRILSVIRADFMNQCSNYAEIADLINASRPTGYMVKSLCLPDFRAELEEAIAQPAIQQGVKFEPGLVQQIIADVVDRPGALPLLQYALKKLWTVCIEEPESPEPCLTWVGYDAIGRVGGALEQHANLLYESLSDEEQALARRLFVEELVQVQSGEDKTVTRRNTTWKQLDIIAQQTQVPADIFRGIVTQFTNERLLVADDVNIAIAHESLLREWQRLCDWIETDRERIRLRRRLENDFWAWRNTYDESDDALLMGTHLSAIEDNLDWEKLPEADYVRKSRDHRDRELRELKRLKEAAEKRAEDAEARVRAEKRGRRAGIAASVLAICALGLGLLVQQRQSAIMEQKLLNVGVLIGQAEELLNSYNELEALKTSVEALGELQKLGREDKEQLEKLQSILSRVRERDRFKAHEGIVQSLAISHNGQILVSGGSEGTVNLWDLYDKSKSVLPETHGNFIRRVEFSPDDNLLASSDVDGVIKIWNNADRSKFREFNYGSYIMDISFSPDSKLLAASGGNNGIIIWDIQGEKVVQRISVDQIFNSEMVVHSLDFHPKNSSLLAISGGKEKQIILWNLEQASSKPFYFSQDFQNLQTVDVRFNSSGSMIASYEEPGVIKLWSYNGEIISKVLLQGDLVYSISFSSDNKYLLATTSNKGLNVWKIDDLRLAWSQKNANPDTYLEPIRSNNGNILTAVFLPVSDQEEVLTERVSIASGDRGGFVSLWETSETLDFSNLGTKRLVEVGCNMLNRYLGDNEKSSQQELAEGFQDICY